jgi:hypothetical protein
MELMFDYMQKTMSQEGKTELEKFLAVAPASEIQKFLLDNIIVTIPQKVRLLEIPNLAPPYPQMWFEWDAAGKRHGVYVSSGKNEEGWDLMFICFLRASRLIMLPLVLRFKIPPNGRIPQDGLESAYRVNGSSLNLLPQKHGEVDMVELDVYSDKMFAEFALPIFFALGLLHCKNIVTIEKGGKNPNIKNRRHRSKGTVHYVLDVVPARHIKRTEYEQPAKGSPQRIHFRRGHFKEYTAERPLFGKYTGTFWWEAHVAGNADIGEVKKDYRILPMRE